MLIGIRLDLIRIFVNIGSKRGDRRKELVIVDKLFLFVFDTKFMSI